MENRPDNTFQYSYSAKQQEEIKSIRQKYQPPEEDKLARLRRLDASVTKKGMIAALTVGILSCLVFGAGMSCIMVGGNAWFVPGIPIGVAGLVGITAAYPIYSHITKKERERIAPEILRLTDELMQ